LNITTKNNIRLNLSQLSQIFLKTLAYYDIFRYPLTKEEIYYNSPTNGDTKEYIFNEIDILEKKGLIKKYYDFYFLFNNKENIKRRILGNKRASKKIRTARCFSNIISRFPYIRAVFISGSLSKGYMDEDSDIDFFVVTKSNRLWIARFLLMLFKKIFLFNSKKNFCINYYITTDNLEIENKNIFTAIELASLLPMYGSNIYENLISSNNWIKNYVPNYPKRELKKVKKFNIKITQRIIEPIFNNSIGEILDDYCMKIFYKYDKRKYHEFNEERFQRSFIFKKNISTHYPESFQPKVLNALEQKIVCLQIEHNILIN